MYNRSGGNVLNVERLPREQLSEYGLANDVGLKITVVADMSTESFVLQISDKSGNP